jgi:hypothetical protein
MYGGGSFGGMGGLSSLGGNTMSDSGLKGGQGNFGSGQGQMVASNLGYYSGLV